ncbi:hypothetical protein G6F46_009572 [Rhizopus delemar]|uniref:BZIP domain-containing protein n=1 Tax=Rhizopus delemar TaxID=936053 RepID=A0A9P7CS07_9FUNG|nr:hypothetical protein G6F43_000546 [Rhizopus delemar]KAG1625455.1 hypothetical protein G6F45_009159 [Rhizopus arrhizus]KAG1522119.1 hypothetical protein G6F52_006141 [Rhizopus delemar]KAG1557839.1 hypothetical protein G6F49_005036 [Rhizopus delemar]KAG1573043.1 hypothetical protein G6F50_003197 [Rhizopus delemar]
MPELITTHPTETDLPPTYATLPTTKLEEEPNPFEQSFQGATHIIPPLPPEKEHGQVMIQKVDLSSNMINAERTMKKEETIKEKKSKRARKTGKTEEDEMKRKNFLERNRIAALKCRQRKKQWLQNLQTKVEYLTADNEQYNMQASALREELIHLKTLLMAHKDCPINQKAMVDALNRPIPGLPSLTQPYDYNPPSLTHNN